MPTNELSFNQVATILQAIQNQATGVAAAAPVDTASFVASAQTVLKTGYEQVYRAISTVLGRTIFSIRPYNRKFRGMEFSESAFKLHTRKIQIGDSDFEDNDTADYPVFFDDDENPASGDGKSVDQQTIKKSPILQTNFYGINTYQNHYTLYDADTVLDVAFSNPEEMARFIQMIVTNMANMFEQSRETLARATIANLMGGIIDINDSSRIVHLLTEYNNLTGLSLTAQTVYQPANFAPFMRWAFSRIAAISALMTERSELYQQVVNNVHIMRHTPYEDQRVYLYAPAQFQIEMQVLADTYHDNYLKLADNETVNFWQAIRTPDSISVTPSYIGANGEVQTGDAVNQSGIFGIICDREAAGYTVLKSTIKPSPYNARSDYQNFWLKDYQKSFVDHTEKSVILLLD